MPPDSYDSLQLAGEAVHKALRAPRGAEQYTATKEAIAALQASLAAQETAILRRWQAVGRSIIVAGEVAPTLDMRRDLAADMLALGWVPDADGWHAPGKPWRRLSRADWQGVVEAMVKCAEPAGVHVPGEAEDDIEQARRLR